MPFNADVFKVMIASPGDVAKEREIIRNIIHQWNYVNSFEKKMVLLPISWETHSAPEMGSEAQNIINKRILKDCDLLIGTFWTRLGTETKNSDSGTVEEIEKHISLNKPAMLYFSSIPVQPESINSEQYSKLKKFEEKCRSNGLIETYDSLSEFNDKLRRQLSILISQNEYFQTDLTIIGNIEPESNDIPQFNLTDESKSLLSEAAESSQGNIIKLNVSHGLIIQANNKQFVTNGDPKSRAKWEYALKDLVNNGLVEEKGYKGEIFEVTHIGYQVAQKIKLGLA